MASSNKSSSELRGRNLKFEFEHNTSGGLLVDDKLQRSNRLMQKKKELELALRANSLSQPKGDKVEKPSPIV